MNKTSEAQRRAVSNYEKNKIEFYRYKFPKGNKEILKKCAAKNGESVNAMIHRLVKNEVIRVLSKSDSNKFK